MTLLEAHDLSIGYGSTRIADGLNLAVDPGTVTCLSDRLWLPVAILGKDRFTIEPVETVMTAAELSSLYGVALNVEQTPSGRFVVRTARAAGDT